MGHLNSGHADLYLYNIDPWKALGHEYKVGLLYYLKTLI